MRIQNALLFINTGGVRHDPQRFMGKIVAVYESNPGIKTLLPFLKNITEESDLENFQDLIVALDVSY